MNASDEDERREKLRALEKMRGQPAAQPPVAAKPPSEGNNQRGAKLRELLQQRRQGGNAGNAQQAGGGGMLLRALAERGGAGAGGNRPGGGGGGEFLRIALAKRGGGGQQGLSMGPDAKGAGAGNRGQLLRRIMEARQNREGGGQPNQVAEQLSELQNRVLQLTEEVERLRASQGGQPAAAAKDAAANPKKAERAAPKMGRDKT